MSLGWWAPARHVDRASQPQAPRCRVARNGSERFGLCPCSNATAKAQLYGDGGASPALPRRGPDASACHCSRGLVIAKIREGRVHTRARPLCSRAAAGPFLEKTCSGRIRAGRELKISFGVRHLHPVRRAPECLLFFLLASFLLFSGLLGSIFFFFFISRNYFCLARNCCDLAELCELVPGKRRMGQEAS